MAKNTPGRVVKPRNPKDNLELSQKVYSKHLADGANSPLKGLVGYDWNVVGPTITAALDAHNKAESLKGQMEEQYRIRDAAAEPIKDITNASATFLKSKFSKAPKTLTQWGFEIDDTPAKPRKKKGE